MAKHDPVITYYQAARIHAQVWVEDPTPAGKANGPREKLDKDPYQAIDPRKKGFGILDGANGAKLLDLELYNEDLGDIDFSNDGPYTQVDLHQMYLTGQDPYGNQVKMNPSLWITPSGNITEVGSNPAGITLADWARIYAYIWYQARSGLNTALKDDFEIDPVNAFGKHGVIVKINNESNMLPNPPPIINYNPGPGPGQTPLITHGAPPSPRVGEPSFQAISDDPNAKGYRYIVRFSC